MSEKTVKVIKCPKCGTEKETTSNTSTGCPNPACKNVIWVPSNIASGKIDSRPAAEKKPAVDAQQKKPTKTKAEKTPSPILTLELSDVLAAQVVVDALKKGELCVGCAELAESGDLVAVLCEHTDGVTIVHAILQTPDSSTKFVTVVPVMTL